MRSFSTQILYGTEDGKIGLMRVGAAQPEAGKKTTWKQTL